MFQTKFNAPIVEAAQAGMTVFDNHVDPALVYLPRRFLYTLHATVEPRTIAEMTVDGIIPNSAYFGVNATDFGPGFKSQWNAYVAWRRSKVTKGAVEFASATVSSGFWRSKEPEWTILSPVARFWIEFETSSICCERDIAKVRDFDTPLRQSMLPRTFKREVFFRCNLWILEEMLEDALVAHREAIGAAVAGMSQKGGSEAPSGGASSKKS